jgi:hypothetical protein
MNSIIANTQDAAAFADGSKTAFTVPVKDGVQEGWDMVREQSNNGVFYKECKGTLYLCPYHKPPYQLNQEIYVREAWIEGQKMDDGTFDVDEDGEYIDMIWYKAKSPNLDWYDGTSDFPRENAPWKSPAIMPKSAARTQLKITEVECKRVQDIYKSYPDFITKYGQQAWDNNIYCWYFKIEKVCAQ